MGNTSNIEAEGVTEKVLEEKKSLKKILDILETDKKNNWEELRQRIPQNEEEILRFLDNAVLEDQPTEVLVQLAQKLKDRRTKMYQTNSEEALLLEA